MRNLKRYLAVVLAVAMLISIVAPAIAATEDKYSSEATKLNAMGLYQGVSTTSFDPDLASTLDRQTAAVFLARLAGLEQEAKDSDLAEAKATLNAKFKDAAQVSDWAVKHLALYVDAGVIKGFPDGTFQPKGLVTGRQFCTMALKQLGYEVPVFEEAGKQFAEAAGLDAAQQAEFEVNTAIKKSILIGISFKALGTKESGKETTLVEGLVKSGVVAADKAEEAGFVIAPSEPTAAPTSSATVAPTSVPGTVYGAVYSAVAVVNDLPVGTLSTGSTVNKVFKFTVTAPVEQDMTISSFIAKKYGTADAGTLDISKVYLMDGDTILVSGTLNNGEVRLNKSIVIAKGTTKTYCLAVDITGGTTPATATRTVVLGLDSAASVVSTPAVAPFTTALQGGTYSIISASIGSVSTVTVGDQGVTAVKVGELSKDLGNFQLTADSKEDLKLTNLTLTANSLTPSNFDNFYIYDETLTKIDVKGVVLGSKVTFAFGDKSPIITKSNTKKFYLKGDIISGSSTSGYFKIDNNYDIVAKGQLSGANVSVNMSSLVALLTTASITGANVGITVSAGTPTLVDTSNVPTQVIATSSTKGMIREWQITSPSEEMNITQMVFTVGFGMGANMSTTFSSLYVTDENGNVISGPISAPALGTLCDVTFPNVNWYIPTGTAKKFQLRATTVSDSVASIYIDAQVKAGGVSYTLTTTNTQSTVASSAVPTALSQTKMLVTAGTLRATTDSTSVLKFVPAGSKNANVARYLLGATKDKVKITKVRVTATTAGSTGLSSLSGYVSNMGLYVNGALKGVITGTPTGSMYFDLDLSTDPLYVEKDQTVQVEVRADIDQTPGSPISTADFTNNGNSYIFGFTTATAYSNTTNVTLTGTNLDGTPVGGIVKVADGQLSMAAPASQVIADKVVGNIDTELVRAKYIATNEDINLTQISLKVSATNCVTATGAVTNVKVYDGTTLVGTYPSFVGTTDTVINIPLSPAVLLSKDDTNGKTLVVKGQMDKDSWTSGKWVSVALVADPNTTNLKGIGALSSKTLYPVAATVCTTGGALTKVNARTEVKVATDSPSGNVSSSGTMPFLKFSVKALENDAYIATNASIYVTTGGSTTVNLTTQSLELYKVESNGNETLVAQSCSTGSTNMSYFVMGDTDGDMAQEAYQTGFAVPKDQTITFVVRLGNGSTSALTGKSASVTLSGLIVRDAAADDGTAIYTANGGSFNPKIVGSTLSVDPN